VNCAVYVFVPVTVDHEGLHPVNVYPVGGEIVGAPASTVAAEVLYG